MTVASFSPLVLDQFDSLLTTPEAVEQLNQTILQLAVQGKLTQRNPFDEPASELIKKIRNDRKIADTPVIKQGETPFELPDGWIWFKFKDIGEIFGGKTPSMDRSEYWDGTIPWVSPKDMWEDIVVGSEKMITHKALEQMKLVPEGSLLIVVRSGILKRKLPVSINAVQCTVNQDLKVIVPYIPELNRYLKLMLNGLQPFILKHLVKQGMTVQSVKWDEFINAPFPLPPLAEQDRIVARLEELLAQTRQLADKLARNEQELTLLNQSALAHLLASQTLEEFEQHWNFIAEHFDSLFTEPEHVAPLRQSILELAVRGKLTRREAGDESAGELLKRIQNEKAKNKKKEIIAPIKDDENPFDLPAAWEWARLKQITLDLQTGPFGSNLHKSDYVSNGIPVVNPVNMRDGKIVPLGEMMISEKTRERLSQYILEAGDLVLARRGEIGRCALVTEKESGWLCGTGSLRMKLSENISKGFIVLLLKTDFARSRLTKETVGITMSNMSQTALENLIFALPPLAEQERIVAKVEQLLSLCDALESRLWEARESRGRLVESVLAGVGG